MLRIHLHLRATVEPLKRVPLVIVHHGDATPVAARTDRHGVAELESAGGDKVLGSGSPVSR